MRFQKLNTLNRESVFSDKFGGYEHIASPDANCFYDMLNCSSDALPHLGTRKKRARFVQNNDLSGGKRTFADNVITAVGQVENRICYATKTGVYFNDTLVANADLDANVTNRNIVAFGRGCFVVPDGKYLVAATNSQTPMLFHAAYSVQANGASVRTCTPTGGNVSVDYFGTVAPASAQEGDCWLNPQAQEPQFYYYENGAWQADDDAFAIIRANGIGRYAKTGDTVVIEGLAQYSVRVKVVLAGENFMMYSGCLVMETLGTKNVTVSKQMPRLDFAAEHLNRIWGCRYGMDASGNFVNEIYACKQGDPTVWDAFEGISTDAYTVSLGCPGEFTGVAELGSQLLFFKENCIIRVSGSIPSDFHVTVIPCRGVKKGEDKSIVMLNEKIFYKGLSGIYVYDGTLPYCISDDLGEDVFFDTVAGEVNGKYYVAMSDSVNSRYIYVFDTKSGRWFKEDDNLNTRFFIRLSGCLYDVCLPPQDRQAGVSVYSFYAINPDKAVQGNIFSNTATGANEYTYIEEENFDWFAQSGNLSSNNVTTSCLRNMTYSVEKNSQGFFAVGVKSNHEAQFRELCRLQNARQGSFRVTVNTPRCDSFCVKLWGKGAATVFSRVLITEKTGEVRHIDE